MIGRGTARRLGWGRVTRPRASDKAEGWVVLLLLVVFFTVGPAFGAWGGRTAYRDDLRAQQRDRQHAFRVDAVLVQAPSPLGAYGAQAGTAHFARASWTALDGSRHTGAVAAETGAEVGSFVHIWIDDSGAQRAAPAGRSPVAQAIAVSTSLVLLLTTVLAGLYRIVRLLLDRQRARAWQREWLEVGPRWSRHRH